MLLLFILSFLLSSRKPCSGSSTKSAPPTNLALTACIPRVGPLLKPSRIPWRSCQRSPLATVPPSAPSPPSQRFWSRPSASLLRRNPRDREPTVCSRWLWGTRRRTSVLVGQLQGGSVTLLRSPGRPLKPQEVPRLVQDILSVREARSSTTGRSTTLFQEKMPGRQRT